MQNMHTIIKNVVTFANSKKEIQMRKFKFFVFAIGSLLFLMASCLNVDEDEDLDNWKKGNAQIASFSLRHDSIEGLSKVKFTIDQLNNRIFNKDSMPYGTVIDRKVLCDINYDIGTVDVYFMGILFVEQLSGDSIWGTVDSVDFSAPVMITVYPVDGLSTKTYEAKLNVHQVNPDSMEWYKYSDLISGKTFQDMKVIAFQGLYYMYVFENGVYSLYKTEIADMINWTKVSLSGFPDDAILSQIVEFEGDLYVMSEQGVLYSLPAGQNQAEEQLWSQVMEIPVIKTLLGSLPENNITGRTSVLSCIAEIDDVLSFISLNRDMEWKIGTVVPETFPVSGFGAFNFESMYHTRLAIATGRDMKNNLSNKAWSTMDGLSWASLTNERATFSAREGAAVSYYDKCFFVVGGIDASGNALNDIFYSKDQGVNWSDTAYVMPEDCTPRGFSSVIVDENNYMLLFGGKAGNDRNVLNELWRGRINRLGFGKE